MAMIVILVLRTGSLKNQTIIVCLFMIIEYADFISFSSYFAIVKSIHLVNINFLSFSWLLTFIMLTTCGFEKYVLLKKT